MADWAVISQILQNVALGGAAVAGAIVAWRGVPPARSQADAARAQAELARRIHVLTLFESGFVKLADEHLQVRLGVYTFSDTLQTTTRISPCL